MLTTTLTETTFPNFNQKTILFSYYTYRFVKYDILLYSSYKLLRHSTLIVMIVYCEDKSIDRGVLHFKRKHFLFLKLKFHFPV